MSPLEANTYVLEVRETNGSCGGEPLYQDTNYHNGVSIYSYKKEKQWKRNKGLGAREKSRALALAASDKVARG